MSPNSNHTMVAGFGTVMTRIRTPTAADVLCGRGGGINNHEGNKVYRQWVNDRKADYNLFQAKKDKMRVAHEIYRKVLDQVPIGGRFLTKDQDKWWVEIDKEKAIQKTTQALREGAPKIRQALQHQENSPQLVPKSARKRKKKSSEVAAATTSTTATPTATATVAIHIDTPYVDDATETMVLQAIKQDASSLRRYKSEQMLLPTTDYNLAMGELQENVSRAKDEADRQLKQDQKQPALQQVRIAPLTSNKAFKEMYSRPQHQQETSNKNHGFPLGITAFDPFADTPPLLPATEPAVARDMPDLNLDGVPPPPKRTKLRRNHSLTSSVCDGSTIDPVTGEPLDFGIVFADETDMLVANENNNGLTHHETSSVPNQLTVIGDGVTGDNDSTQNNSRLSCTSITARFERELLSSCSLLFTRSRASSMVSLESDDDDANSLEGIGDYFFHDGLPENDFAQGTRTVMDAVHPALTTPDEKPAALAEPSSLLFRSWAGSTNSLILPLLSAIRPEDSNSLVLPSGSAVLPSDSASPYVRPCGGMLPPNGSSSSRSSSFSLSRNRANAKTE